MNIKKWVRKNARKMGYDWIRFEPESSLVARRKFLLDLYKIDVVLDVGANVGQYAIKLRDFIGYKKKIVSIEPLSSAFQKLKENAEEVPNWEVHNYAIGDYDGTSSINISGISDSSSILEMLDTHTTAAPETEYVGTEEVQVRKLNSIFHDLCNENDNVFLKIDTQGYEGKVIDGADQCLSFIDTIQLEMSLVPLYENEMLFVDLLQSLTEKGYTLIGLEPGFYDNKTQQLLQVDGIFRRI